MKFDVAWAITSKPLCCLPLIGLCPALDGDDDDEHEYALVSAAAAAADDAVGRFLATTPRDDDADAFREFSSIKIVEWMLSDAASCPFAMRSRFRSDEISGSVPYFR